ncbi:hypothetical protein MMC19_000549 [Ptychographa xylographoides]|nr:hypothetical protein [Ptychographa xylographoides]
MPLSFYLSRRAIAVLAYYLFLTTLFLLFCNDYGDDTVSLHGGYIQEPGETDQYGGIQDYGARSLRTATARAAANGQDADPESVFIVGTTRFVKHKWITGLMAKRTLRVDVEETTVIGGRDDGTLPTTRKEPSMQRVAGKVVPSSFGTSAALSFWSDSSSTPSTADERHFLQDRSRSVSTPAVKRDMEIWTSWSAWSTQNVQTWGEASVWTSAETIGGTSFQVAAETKGTDAVVKSGIVSCGEPVPCTGSAMASREAFASCIYVPSKTEINIPRCVVTVTVTTATLRSSSSRGLIVSSEGGTASSAGSAATHPVTSAVEGAELESSSLCVVKLTASGVVPIACAGMSAASERSLSRSSVSELPTSQVPCSATRSKVPCSKSSITVPAPEAIVTCEAMFGVCGPDTPLPDAKAVSQVYETSVGFEPVMTEADLASLSCSSVSTTTLTIPSTVTTTTPHNELQSIEQQVNVFNLPGPVILPPSPPLEADLALPASTAYRLCKEICVQEVIPQQESVSVTQEGLDMPQPPVIDVFTEPCLDSPKFGTSSADHSSIDGLSFETPPFDKFASDTSSISSGRSGLKGNTQFDPFTGEPIRPKKPDTASGAEGSTNDKGSLKGNTQFNPVTGEFVRPHPRPWPDASSPVRTLSITPTTPIRTASQTQQESTIISITSVKSSQATSASRNSASSFAMPNLISTPKPAPPVLDTTSGGVSRLKRWLDHTTEDDEDRCSGWKWLWKYCKADDRPMNYLQGHHDTSEKKRAANPKATNET